MAGEADLVVRYAHRAAYWPPGGSGTSVVVEDTLTGASDPRPGGSSLYFVSDHVGTQDPKGNVTTIRTDDNYDVPPGGLGANCGRFDRSDQASTGGGNTGLVCHERAPEDYITSYAFDGFGQRAAMTAPNGATTTYSYFADTDLDLTGSVSAGGWLHTVTDPTGEFVAFGYDRAGNVVRTWDRNATTGNSPSSYPGTLAAPPPDHAETRYGPGTAVAAFEAPWRWPVRESDQLGNTVDRAVDVHGNVTRLRPPRGVEAGSATFDLTQTYSARDEVLSTTTPAGTEEYRYDTWGNPMATIDGNGHAAVVGFDAVNRAISQTLPRGAWADANPTEAARCRESTTGDDPIPAGRTVCTSTTAFDGLDQAYATTDPDGHTSWTAFDDAGRATTTWTPRDPGAGEWLQSSQAFDANSNVVLSCPPRQFDEAGGPCTTPARFGAAMAYDGLNRPVSETRWREAIDVANQGALTGGWVELTTTTSYDLANRTVTVDGPRTDVDDTQVSTYDVLDRPVTQRVNRDATTTLENAWVYDPAGNVTAMTEGTAGGTAPARTTAYRFDAAHRLIDTVEAASSSNAAASDNSFVATEGSDPANIRTRNVYDADGNIRAVLGPRAFTGSVTNPNLRFMNRVDVDNAGRTVARWEAYWDNTTDAALNSANFRADCPKPGAGHQPAPIAGVSAYPATTGICVTRAQFDPVGNVVRVDNPTAVVAAQNQRFQTFAYSDDDLLIGVGAPNPAAGDVDARIDTVRMGYDASGRVLSQSTPTGRITTTGGTEERWVTETAYTPDGLATIVEQRPLSSPTAERRTETTFDHAGNPVQVDTKVTATRTDTTTTEWYADGMRRQESTTVTGHNAGDIVWRWGYDPAGNTTHTWSPSAVALAANNTAGEPTTMAYSPDGLVTQMTEPVRADGTRHRQTSLSHDPLGRVVVEEVALVGVDPLTTPPKAFTWTTLGQPKTEVGRLGATQSFAYNAAGQLTGASEDAFGGNLSAGYYLNGWLRSTSTDHPDTQPYYQYFQYLGDGLEGGRAFGTDPSLATGENFQGFVYNDARALTLATAVGWGFAWNAWNLTYDRAGQVTGMTDPPNGSAPARDTTLDRNPDGTVAQRTLHTGAAGSSVIDEWTYGYDSIGRVASRNRSGQAGSLNAVYGYDEAGRLATINTGQVIYDPNGNRLSGPGDIPTLTFRADNSIATGPGPNGSGTETYDYAAWGGLLRDACRTYSYDGFDRAKTTTVRQDTPGDPPRCPDLFNPDDESLAPNDDKRYDPLGRNIRARHDTLNLTGATVDTEYVNLHHVGLDQTVAYENTVGAPVRSGRYVNTPDGTPLAVSNENGQYQFLHRDGHGDTVAAITPAGAVACGPEIDQWGQSDDDPCMDPLSVDSPNRRWYNSARLDPATGTYQWGTRTYNPTTATWQQPDTPALSGAPSQVSIGTDPLVANRYSYVNGDPINYSDPTGHIMEECATGEYECRPRRTGGVPVPIRRKPPSTNSTSTATMSPCAGGKIIQTTVSSYDALEGSFEGALACTTQEVEVGTAIARACTAEFFESEFIRYLTGELPSLCGFPYFPVIRDTDGGTRALDPYGDCSTPGPFGPGDTGASFDFADACDAHDYAYDLLRFLDRGDDLLYSADQKFHRDLEAHCDTRSSTGWILSTKSRCEQWADIYYWGVSARSVHYDYGPISGPIATEGGS